MYIIPVEVTQSEINGKGVFSLEEILKDSIVWKFDGSHDKTMSVAEYTALDAATKKELDRVAYLSTVSNQYVFPPENDPALYTNHSENNNLSVVYNADVSLEPYFVANRDIHRGEELTNNYHEFDSKLKEEKPEWIG